MKRKLIAALLLTTWCAHGQNAFAVDQQSTNLIEGGVFLQSGQPMGQSFTPSVSSVSFVELNLYDSDVFHDSGATVYVNVRSNSITGLILGSSADVFMPDQFFGITNFLFSTPVAITPGVTYYLQPQVRSGDTMGSYVTDGSYAGGTAINQGVPVPARDLWFREGIVVPEPSSFFFLVAGGAFALLTSFGRRKARCTK